MITLLVATRNAHKVQEIQSLLSDACRCVSLRDLPGAPEVVEDAGTFAGNATKKAITLARWVAQDPGRFSAEKLFALADDSGLEVDALGGAPGVHSARFAAVGRAETGNSPDSENNARLLSLLREIPVEKRTARFRCVLALAPVVRLGWSTASPVCSADEIELSTELFEGTCEGKIDFAPRGKSGFGYDPLFIPNGFTESFGELGEAVKNRISHRARAIEKLRRRLVKE